MTTELLSVIDLQRYPITDLDGSAGQILVNDCRQQLSMRAICILRQFIEPSALAQLAEEARVAGVSGHYISEPRYSYSREDLDQWPIDHPRRTLHKSSYVHALNCHVRNDSLLRKLFLFPTLTEFVRRVLGHDVLYTSACPYLALSLHIAEQGDCNGWHFDPNDGVVTLMLQAPDDGGEFEYAPYIRSDDDENYAEVKTLFADPATHATRVKLNAGDLVLFNGRFSAHRVAPVGETKKPRIMAIFSYDQQPDMVFSQTYIDHVQSFPPRSKL